MEIEILNVREGAAHDKDKSLFTFDVKAGSSFYIDLKIMPSSKGGKYIVYPSRKRQDPLTGKESWLRLYDWGKERNEQFDKAVKETLTAMKLI